MTRKRPHPPKGMSEPEAVYRHEGEEDMTEAQWMAWEERNRDALIASLREAEAQIARGEGHTLEEVMARVQATIKRVAKKP
ncbi:MAG: hypothetical protein JOZ72_11580 [Alphaproteobacteria bacterium]|nr:hypothetical protein [Alphaproteobacteria bacterium]